VAAIFGPGTNIAEAATQILDVLLDRYDEEAPIGA
jgi:methylmalonyl-CoA mutase